MDFALFESAPSRLAAVEGGRRQDTFLGQRLLAMLADDGRLPGQIRHCKRAGGVEQAARFGGEQVEQVIDLNCPARGAGQVIQRRQAVLHFDQRGGQHLHILF